MDHEEDAGPLGWHCLQRDDIQECIKDCAMNRIFTIFGKKHAMPIIHMLFLHGTLRFNDLLGKLRASPKTLTDRLRELQAAGLIHREAFNEIPVRVEYSLSPRGKALEPIFIQLQIWARESS